tara:strand:- start:361 stop:2055 length:1695 start_codon:yes stop_codon:yes gene_type:complete
MKKNIINLLKRNFSKFKIEGYVIPKNDEFFSEFDENNRLYKISNFSGSAGLAIITKKMNYLFVDGRYSLQAKKESGKNFKIYEITKKLPKDIFKGIALGVDPKIITSSKIKNLFHKKTLIKKIDLNLIDLINSHKPLKKKQFFKLDDKIVGESKSSKINKISNYLKKIRSDYLLITAPENVAWTLNIRGGDNPHSPIPNCHLFIDKYKNFFLITEKSKTKKIIKEKVIKKDQLIELDNLKNFFETRKPGKISIDHRTCSFFFEEILKKKFKIIKFDDPVYKLKSIKNDTEINNMLKAHHEDGLALTRFIYWIKHNKKKISEIDAQNKLEKFRKFSKNYLFPSFNTIAGAGPNGAIVHYRANKKNCRIIKKNDIFLFDSGGQYKYGTTDVTRTVCFEKPKKKIRDIFTRVLKGHIAVYLSNLNKKSTGKKIDFEARKFLKQKNLDYAHGTGHGVGYFLNVHEGPQSISKYNNIKLRAGMILSNEPGYYKENEYGIRIENLVYIKKIQKKIKFQNLTFAPIDNDLINYEMLSKSEKNYLFNYHFNIYSKYSKNLKSNERKWLANLI